MNKTRSIIEQVATSSVDGIIKVHRSLGPGLLESAYQTCLQHELKKRGHEVQTELLLPIRYDGIIVENAYRADMLIDDCLLIENKVVQSVLPIHKTQVFTYLKLSGLRLGLLANWNTELMKNGIFRIVNGL